MIVKADALLKGNPQDTSVPRHFGTILREGIICESAIITTYKVRNRKQRKHVRKCIKCETAKVQYYTSQLP